MEIDLVCLAFVLLFGLLGFRSGFVVQLTRLVALVVAFFAARWVSPPLGAYITNGLDTTPFVGEAMVFAAIFFLVSFAINLMAGALVRELRGDSKVFTFFDRGLGGILGGCKGAALVFILISIFVVLGPSVRDSIPLFPKDFRGSVVGREALRQDFLQRQVFPRGRALMLVVRALRNPGAFQQALADPRFQTVLQRPEAAFLKDPLIQKAILLGEWEVLVRDGRVFSLLEDIDVVNALNEIELEDPAQLPAEAPPPDAPLTPTPTPQPAPNPAPNAPSAPAPGEAPPTPR